MTQRADSRWGSASIAVWLAAVIGIAGGGTTRAEKPCLPQDLVQGLLGSVERSVFVGAPAPEAMNALPLPDGSAPIGGMSMDNGITVIASSPRSSAQTRAEMKGLLESGGWKPRADDQPRGGFMARQREQNVDYCNAEGSLLHFAAQDRQDGGSLLTVHRRTTQTGVCDRAYDGASRMTSGPMPALEPPAGVAINYQGSAGMGHDGRRGESVGLATGDAPRDLAAHFGAQLADQGWTLDSDLAGDSMATQMWSLTDATGRPWRGILLVAVLGEGSRDATFSVTPRD